MGTERLFTDGVFFTDIEYCESFGHDLETGAPHTKDQYREFNPNGRAILKAAHFIPPLEVPDDDYPMQLSTGPNVYHFHIRTKTGRSKKLQEAAPQPRLTISPNDAKKVSIEQDDMVLVESRRGKIEIQASIGDIAAGQIFVPFHYGYFDAKDDRARAANELTDGNLDPSTHASDAYTNPFCRAMGPYIQTADAQIRCRACQETLFGVRGFGVKA